MKFDSEKLTLSFDSVKEFREFYEFIHSFRPDKVYHDVDQLIERLKKAREYFDKFDVTLIEKIWKEIEIAHP